jgi:hypothetical protein
VWLSTEPIQSQRGFLQPSKHHKIFKKKEFIYQVEEDAMVREYFLFCNFITDGVKLNTLLT